MKKTLGGDRLGAGKKMQVDLHGFGRSTHDLSYLWRSTMSAGTLVPFMVQVGLPGDTWDVNLHGEMLSHPTVGPLFGSFKAQYDVFVCPIRLYQGQLHNNKLGIGLKMADVKLPIFSLTAPDGDVAVVADGVDYNNMQINPSSILKYLGLSGIGWKSGTGTGEREFNGVSWLAYWDIYKNYYANKQEEIGAVIHNVGANFETNVTEVEVDGSVIPQSTGITPVVSQPGTVIQITTSAAQDWNQVILYTTTGGIRVSDIGDPIPGTSPQQWIFNTAKYGNRVFTHWDYIRSFGEPTSPSVQTFPLSDIDAMREAILQHSTQSTPFLINDSAGAPDTALQPWQFVLELQRDIATVRQPFQFSQEGLALKTYQSDLFNNWLSTEWIDGTGGINEITSIDTSGGSFTIDTLQMAKKVYDMLNRIAVSGGSYDDWLDAVWMTDRTRRAESPIYVGGLSKELVFQEVVSNAESNPENNSTQPLGTLAGRGKFNTKNKGGHIVIHVEEPSYIIGLISLTPRVDYFQGNTWDLHLKTMDDFHKPNLDEIGFQELITEQMAWWNTSWNGTTWVQRSAGKQPAWVNYMTNVNKVYGNFAVPDNEGFMVLTRRYTASANGDDLDIDDMTTYIDPAKFNHIFAQTSLDAQNFWSQIAVDIECRRVMSAKVMPNL